MMADKRQARRFPRQPESGKKKPPGLGDDVMVGQGARHAQGVPDDHTRKASVVGS